MLSLFFALVAGIARAGAQPESSTTARHRFGGRVSLAVGQAREDLLIPIPQTGPGLSLRVLFRLETSRWFLEGAVGAAVLVGFDRYGTTNGVMEPGLTALPNASSKLWPTWTEVADLADQVLANGN